MSPRRASRSTRGLRENSRSVFRTFGKHWALVNLARTSHAVAGDGDTRTARTPPESSVGAACEDEPRSLRAPTEATADAGRGNSVHKNSLQEPPPSQKRIVGRLTTPGDLAKRGFVKVTSDSTAPTSAPTRYDKPEPYRGRNTVFSTQCLVGIRTKLPGQDTIDVRPQTDWIVPRRCGPRACTSQTRG